MNNPYKTLGVEENADDIQIKKAYKKLAMQHHPDKGGDSDTKGIQEQLDALTAFMESARRRL